MSTPNKGANEGDGRLERGSVTLLRGNALALPLADSTVDLVVTSPPYFGLRSYTDGGEHYAGQVGDEASPTAFVDALIAATSEMVRVVKPSGSIWVNLGDKYAGSRSGPQGVTGQRAERRQAATYATNARDYNTQVPSKSLMGLPWRYALRCIDDLGLILRAEVIWSKTNGLPESVTDRVRRSHETWFHFVKAQRYYTAVDEVREPHAQTSLQRAHAHRAPAGRRGGEVYPGGSEQTLRLDQANHPLGALPGSVWQVPTQPLVVPPHLELDHFAAFPMEWPRRLIKGWSPSGICLGCGDGIKPLVETHPGRKERNAPQYDSTGTARHGTGSSTLGSRGPSAVIRGAVCPNRCDAPTRPAVVLDPFGGTGTTALVASVLGRRGISVDMSSDYCRLAAWRTTDRGQIASAMQVERPPAVSVDQFDLFGGVS